MQALSQLSYGPKPSGSEVRSPGMSTDTLGVGPTGGFLRPPADKIKKKNRTRGELSPAAEPA